MQNVLIIKHNILLAIIQCEKIWEGN